MQKAEIGSRSLLSKPTTGSKCASSCSPARSSISIAELRSIRNGRISARSAQRRCHDRESGHPVITESVVLTGSPLSRGGRRGERVLPRRKLERVAVFLQDRVALILGDAIDRRKLVSPCPRPNRIEDR